MNNYELYHHGIKGQKWGVRRFQKKDGTLTPAGKKRYSEDKESTKKVSREDKLYEKYKTLGYSDEEARETARGHARTEKALKIIGGVALTAATAYVAYQIYDKNADRTIKANKIIQTVHTGDISERIQAGNPFYATYTKRDNTIYASKVFSHFSDQSSISKMYTKDGIKVASERTSKKIFEQLSKSDPEVREYARRITKIGIKDPNTAFQYSLVLRNNSGDRLKRMGVDDLDHDRIHKKFYDELKKRGYGALMDANDKRREGFTWNPVIIFDDQIKHVVSTTPASKEDLGAAKMAKASAWVSARYKFTKPSSMITPVSVAAGYGYLYSLGSTLSANKSVNARSAYVEQYRAEHPSTKLTNKRIVAMYDKR